MALGISTGLRKHPSSGCTSERRAGDLPASLAKSEYSKFFPRSWKERLHCCTSHSPMMFLSRRNVPSNPPSLVKFNSSVRSDNEGFVTSTPIKDHVPELR